MSHSGSAHFKHLQAEHLNTITISEATYYLKESESGSMVFVNHDTGNSIIYLPRLATRNEDAGMNFKFIISTSDGTNNTSNTVTIISIADSLSESDIIIYAPNVGNKKSELILSSIDNGITLEFITDGTYWYLNHGHSALNNVTKSWNTA